LTEQALPENGYFRLGDYYVDVGDNRVFYGDEGRHLEPKAMHVLYQLALSAGETVSRQDLMDKVWNGRVVIEDALTRIISQLRVTFHDNKSRRLIQTVPKRGYRLAADVSWLTREEFIARSSQVQSPVQQASTNRKYTLLTAVGLSVALVLLFWFLLAPDANEIPAISIDNEHSARQQNGATAVITLAFLPWRNLTGDETNDYLAEMLPEELSTTLAKSERISVFSHYSKAASVSSAQTLESLIDEIYLDYWIEGSITEANEQIRVLVRLIDKSSNEAVWSEVYADEIQQVLQLNARIIFDIQGQLFGQDTLGSSSSQADDIDIEAYRAYLQGNYWWMNGKTSEWYRRAELSFLQATELAPNFAAAFGSLAFIYAR
jgi:DNA-binding winged helix-turn-helix (wHTH) protein/TolB-like protein